MENAKEGMDSLLLSTFGKLPMLPEKSKRDEEARRYAWVGNGYLVRIENADEYREVHWTGTLADL